MLAGVVDPDIASVNALGSPVRGGDVLGPDRTRQAKIDTIDVAPQGILVAPFEDRHDRAKNFLLGQSHMRLHVGKDSSLIEKPVFQRRVVRLLAAAHQPAAVFQTHGHIVFDLVELRLAHQRSHGGFGVGGNARLVPFRQQFDDLFQHLVMNRFVQKNPAGGAAALARPGEVHPRNDAVDQLVNVGIGVSHQRVFAAQLKQHGFEIVGGCFHDRLAGGHAANQCDFGYQRVAAHGVAALAAATQKIGHARRKNITHQFGQPQNRQGCLVRRLDDHRVACGQRCGQPGSGKHEGVVVRHDAGNHAQRLLQRVIEVAVPHGNGLALDLGGQAGKIIQTVSGKASVHGQGRYRVTVVQ